MSQVDAEFKDKLEQLIKDGIRDSFRDVGLNDEEVFELRKDLTFLREQRLTCDKLRVSGLWYLLSVAGAGITGLLVLGFKGWVHLP